MNNNSVMCLLMLVIFVLIIVKICKKKKDEGMEGFDAGNAGADAESPINNSNLLIVSGICMILSAMFGFWLAHVIKNKGSKDTLPFWTVIFFIGALSTLIWFFVRLGENYETSDVHTGAIITIALCYFFSFISIVIACYTWRKDNKE